MSMTSPIPTTSYLPSYNYERNSIHCYSVSLLTVALILAMVLAAVFWKRRQTRKWLEGCGLPVVFWRPRFVRYNNSQQVVSSSSITGILSKMKLLQAPLDCYGTVYGVSTGVVHIAHPLPAKKILQSTSTKTPAYNHFLNFSGRGVFTSDGPEWKAKRASVLHCLIRNIDANHSIETETNRAAQSLLSDLKQQCLQSNNSTVDNIVPLLQRATIGLIYRYITHSHDMDTRLYKNEGESVSRDKAEKEEQQHPPQSRSSSSSSLTSLAEPTTTTTYPKENTTADKRQSNNTTIVRDDDQSLLTRYLESVTQIRMILLAQARSVWFLLPRFIYQCCSRMYQQEEETMGPIREFARQACAEAANKPNSPLAQLSSRASHIDTDGKSDSTISKALLEEAITILFAGQDTSAATLSWTLHLLSLYPDTIQQRLYEEVTSVLSSNEECSNPEISKRAVLKMPYLDAVLKESMRLYPVAPFVVRKVTKDIVVAQEGEESNNDSTTIPKDSLACVWIYSLHRNPKLWSRPNDFWPERWLIAPEKQRDEGIKSGAYMPFATGPRNCVGQPLAHVMLRLLLCHLIKEHKFIHPELKNCTEDPMTLVKDMQVGFTVLPQGGVPLLLQKRNADRETTDEALQS